MARVETERDAAIARAETAEAALVRLRRVAACFAVDVAAERTWCSECRTEHRSRERSREIHPHSIGCVFATTPADLADAQRREWMAKGIDEVARMLQQVPMSPLELKALRHIIHEQSPLEDTVGGLLRTLPRHLFPGLNIDALATKLEFPGHRDDDG